LILLVTCYCSEFGEVPPYFAPELRVGLLRGQVLIQRRDPLALDHHLGQHRELHPVLRRAELRDLLVGCVRRFGHFLLVTSEISQRNWLSDCNLRRLKGRISIRDWPNPRTQPPGSVPGSWLPNSLAGTPRTTSPRSAYFS